MKNLMSKSESNSIPFYMTLKTVWWVEADSGYFVDNAVSNEPLLLIAIRTIDGCGEIITDKKHILPTGSLIIVKREDIKSYNTKNDSWNFRWFEFFAEGNSPIMLNRVVTPAFFEDELTLMNQCFSILSGKSEFAFISANSLFNYIFSMWNVAKSKKNSDIMNVIEYIKGNYDKAISVAYLAKRCSMNERTFREHFKKYTGLSPKQYILKTKLSSAYELLITTNLQIKEIASIYGFANPYHFSKAFSSEYRISPQKLRKNKTREEYCLRYLQDSEASL